MSIPPTYIPIITTILKTLGKSAVKQACKKYMGDETCGGWLN